MSNNKPKDKVSLANGPFAISRKDKPPLLVTTCINGEYVFTRTEFAQRIGVYTSTLVTWEKKGMLVPQYVIGKRRYYTESQAQAYLKAGKKGKHTDSRV